jgi:hypothetical protein
MNAPDQFALPPHSIESEQSLIGGLLIDPNAWDRIADMVSEADFYRDDHRRIFQHIAKLAMTGKQVDLLPGHCQLRDVLENPAMIVAIEIGLRNHIGNAIPGVRVDQQATDQRLLGLDRVRR